MNDWGLANVHLEEWGPFGRGWDNQRFSCPNDAHAAPVRIDRVSGSVDAGHERCGCAAGDADAFLMVITKAEDLDRVQRQDQRQIRAHRADARRETEFR